MAICNNRPNLKPLNIPGNIFLLVFIPTILLVP